MAPSCVYDAGLSGHEFREQRESEGETFIRRPYGPE